jgi:hypothetical protein
MIEGAVTFAQSWCALDGFKDVNARAFNRVFKIRALRDKGRDRTGQGAASAVRG